MAGRINLKQLAQSGATNGQVPAWVAASSTWVPATISGGGGYATGVRQIVTSFANSVQSVSTSLPADATTPQNTEGAQFITATITPQSATSTLLILATIGAMTPGVTSTATSALFRDSTASAFAAGAVAIASGNTGFFALAASQPSTATSATTIRLRVGINTAGTIFLNGYPGPNTYFGGVCSSSLIVVEYGA